jgi:hypothetical protein
VYHGPVRSLLLAAALLAACASPHPLRPLAAGGSTPEAAAGDALARFALAAREGRWEEAWPLLSARWRALTTPARLARDWRGSGPVGPEAAARVLALLRSGAPLAVSGREATLPVGAGRRARLVQEDGGWRVEALE